jgi:hypothetical protein
MTDLDAKKPGQTTAQPEKNRLARIIWGGLIGATLGWFLVKGIPGAAVGALVGWYVVRGISGAIVGGLFGWFFITGVSGAAAGMVAGGMIGGNMVGRKGRWLLLAAVLTISAVSIISDPSWRQQILHWLGF